MFQIQVEIKLIDDQTGEVAKSRYGGSPIEWKGSFYPLFAQPRDGENLVHALGEIVTKAMNLGSDLYRVGGNQKDL